MPQKVCIVALLVVGVLVLDYVRIVAELDARAAAADVRDAEMVVVVVVNLVAGQVVLVLAYKFVLMLVAVAV